MSDFRTEALLPLGWPGPGAEWLESFALLVPGLVLIHLAAPRGQALLELGLAALLVAAAAAWALRRPGTRGGTWWRRGSASSHVPIATRDAVMLAADALLQQAKADQRPLSVAVLELQDLPEVRRLFGRKLAQQVLGRTARKLRAVAGPKGMAVRTSPTQFTVVMPGIDEEAVLLSLRTVFGDACCIEDDGDADEVVLLPHFQVATVDRACGSVEAVYVMLCEKLVSSLHRSYDRRGAPRARAEDTVEPSRPVSLSPAPSELEPGGLPLAYVPTVPLPLI